MASKINILFLGAWMATISIGMFQFGYGLGMFNNFTGVLHQQYEKKGNPVIKDEDMFNSVVTTMVPLGASFGAFTGGMLAGLGRRYALLINNVIIAAGAGITMIFSFYSLIFGRLVLGYGLGVFTVISPLFISETSPAEVAGSMGALSQFMVTAGIMIAYIFGYLAPIRYIKNEGETVNPDVFTTQSWRIVFIMPAVFALIQSLLVLFIFRYDTPKYYKQNGKSDMVEKIELLIYKEQDSDINHSMLTSNNQTSDQKVPVSALCTPKYRMAFIVGCSLALFQQLTGINAVIFYSNNIFTKGSDPGYDTEQAARLGTVIVGVVNWAAAMTSIPLLARFGRKTLLIMGQIVMGISLIVLGLLALFTSTTTGIIVFTLVFVAFFEFSIGPILWLYAAEIMTESGMAAASLITWIITIIFGLFTSALFDLLRPYGMYFTFAGVDILGLVFIIFLIKETKGKSKAEIENLYSDRRYGKLDSPTEDREDVKTRDL
jgi:sugar porter (SP) family MFS transporter